MKRIFSLTIYIVICYSTWGIASTSIDEARKFMNEFLEAEFIGNQSFRVDNVMNSPERNKLIKEMYSPMIGEIFIWESEKLCVVDHYEITNIRIIDSKAEVDVTFQEFACTGKKGYGDSLLIKTNKRSLVKYILEYKKDRWWVYDPPIPRVSRKALIDYNNNIIRRMKEFVIEKGTEVQKKYYYNLIYANNMLEEKEENIEGSGRNMRQDGERQGGGRSVEAAKD